MRDDPRERRSPVEAVPHVLDRARAHGLWPRRAALFHDLDRLAARYRDLESAFPDGTLHAVAVKANPLIEILRVLVDQGAGLEAASWEEVQCALAAGCPASRIVYDGPAKSIDELRLALDSGVLLNADNEQELARIEALGPPDASPIGLRVNPCLGAGSIAMTSTVSRQSKFGVPIEHVPALLERFPFITGLHVHTGSQGVGVTLLHDAAVAVGTMAAAHGLQWLDIGGGIPVRYRDTDLMPPAFTDWSALIPSLSPTLRLVTEVGRSIHAATGWTVSRIESTKSVDGRPTLVVHVGADLLLRRVYRPDQWDHEFTVLDSDGHPKGGPEQPTCIAGPLCFSGDLIARDRMLPAAEPGDLLLIRDTGAYTLSMWSRHCSRGLPPTIGYTHDDIRLLHRGESAADVAAFWSLSAEEGTPSS